MRVLGYDVAGKLRDGDAVTAVTSVTAVVQGGGTGTLNVAVADPAIADATVIRFSCVGGTSGETYTVRIRYASTTESALDSTLTVEVEA